MEDNSKLFVGGFIFQYEEDAKLARDEMNKIKVLEKQANLKVEENLVAVYNKALDTKTFLTPVGWDYLMHLRRTMLDLGVDSTKIPGIPLYMPFDLGTRDAVVKQRIKPGVKKPKKPPYLYKYRISVIINCILAIAVAIMFFITLNSNHPNILNYENAIVNKYASWEQDLQEREREVREKEVEWDILREELD